MDLDDLRCFLAVVEEGGFGAGAARLELSTSTVSRRVSALERRLGVKLFARDARGASLTTEGLAAVAHARTVLREFDGLSAVPDERHPTAGAASLRVGVTASLPTVLSALLAGALSRRDGVADGPGSAPTVVTATADEILAGLEAGDLDLALVHVPLLRPGLATAAVALLEGQVAVAASHRLAGRPSVTAEDLRGERLALRAGGVAPALREVYRQRMAALGVEVDFLPGHEWDSIAQRVRAGEAVTILHHEKYGAVAPAFAGPDVVLVGFDGELARFRTHLVWRTDHPDVQHWPAFSEEITRLFAELEEPAPQLPAG